MLVDAEMKILFISEYYRPEVRGGGEINLAAVAQGLKRAGVEVLVLTSFFPALARYEEQEGVKIYRRLKTGTDPSRWLSNVQRRLLFPRSIIKEVKILAAETSFDLIHCLGTSIIAAPHLKKWNKPLFATIESYPTLCPKGDRLYQGTKECKLVCTLPHFLRCQAKSNEIGKMKNRWYLKYNVPLLLYIYWYYRRLNTALPHCQLTAISTYVQKLLAQHQIHRVTVIPNIIDREKFSSFGFSSFPKLRILYLGSLIESKGPQILLEAIRGIECRCDLYGDGILKERLSRFIEQQHLDAQIHAAVPQENVPALYAQADLVVFPSLWPEPFGRIALEAQASGVPLIASATGGIPELVSPGKGLLVEPGNSEELRRAIMTFLGRRKGEITPVGLQHYSSKAVVSALLSLYQRAVQDSAEQHSVGYKKTER
ncbi:MAG: glycosyltransferase family 4 protein [Nanoarchaeota archaeon]